MHRRILLTGFSNTSSAELLRENGMFDTLLLPSDKVQDTERLIERIDDTHYDLIISLGQKPNIRDRIYIETMAKKKEMSLRTGLDCELLSHIFNQNHICTKISCHAGTSFCNALYWNGLQYITQNRLSSNMVFIHIPFIKNITEPALFKKNFYASLNEILQTEVLQLWRI